MFLHYGMFTKKSTTYAQNCTNARMDNSHSSRPLRASTNACRHWRSR